MTANLPALHGGIPGLPSVLAEYAKVFNEAEDLHAEIIDVLRCTGCYMPKRTRQKANRTMKQCRKYVALSRLRICVTLWENQS